MIAERPIRAYAESTLSWDIFFAGMVTILAPLIVGEKIGEAAANLMEKAGMTTPLRHPEEAVWRFPLRELITNQPPRAR